MLDVPAYLARIRYTGPATPTYETLRALHYAHLLAVPFENLDIAVKRKIVLDEDAILRKIIHQRRGGFCYELNGAFAALLKALGFHTTLLSARVARDTGGESPSSITLPCVWTSNSHGWWTSGSVSPSLSLSAWRRNEIKSIPQELSVSCRPANVCSWRS